MNPGNSGAVVAGLFFREAAISVSRGFMGPGVAVAAWASLTPLVRFSEASGHRERQLLGAAVSSSR